MCKARLSSLAERAESSCSRWLRQRFFAKNLLEKASLLRYDRKSIHDEKNIFSTSERKHLHEKDTLSSAPRTRAPRFERNGSCRAELLL